MPWDAGHWREALRAHAIDLANYLDSTIIDQPTGQDVTPQRV